MMKRFLFAVLALVACSESNSAAPPPAGENDAGADDSSVPSGETQCTAARKTHLGPIGKVSSGAVKVVSTDNGVTTLYVDAAAGGALEVTKNPRVYIKLSGEKVSIDDNAAFTSSDWDLALKRVDVYTNSGDAGPGKGGAFQVNKDFDAVTAADAEGGAIATESFFDEACVGRKDEASFIVTSMSGWYDYAVGGGVSVKPRVSYIVRGADGTTRYKVGVVSYTGRDDGSTNGQSGRFILKIAPL